MQFHPYFNHTKALYCDGSVISNRCTAWCSAQIRGHKSYLQICFTSTPLWVSITWRIKVVISHRCCDDMHSPPQHLCRRAYWISGLIEMMCPPFWHPIRCDVPKQCFEADVAPHLHEEVDTQQWGRWDCSWECVCFKLILQKPTKILIWIIQCDHIWFAYDWNNNNSL